MKQFTITILLLITLQGKSQTTINDVGFTSRKKDTLYLLNCQVSKGIKEVWDLDKSYKKKPKIVFLPEAVFVSLYIQRNKKDDLVKTPKTEG